MRDSSFSREVIDRFLRSLDVPEQKLLKLAQRIKYQPGAIVINVGSVHLRSAIFKLDDIWKTARQMDLYLIVDVTPIAETQIPDDFEKTFAQEVVMRFRNGLPKAVQALFNCSKSIEYQSGFGTLTIHTPGQAIASEILRHALILESAQRLGVELQVFRTRRGSRSYR